MSRPQPRMDTHGEVFGARIVAFVIDAILVGLVAAVLGVLVVGIGLGLAGEGGATGAVLLLTRRSSSSSSATSSTSRASPVRRPGSA